VTPSEELSGNASRRQPGVSPGTLTTAVEAQDAVMEGHIKYRLPGKEQWKESNHLIKALNLRKEAHIDQIVNAFWAAAVEHPMTEDDMHTQMLLLVRPFSQIYRKPMRDPRIDGIKGELGAVGQTRIRQAFTRLLDALKPNGKGRLWTLQEKGKIPMCGAFLFYIRHVGLDVRRGSLLQEGTLEKYTNGGYIVDPVKEGKKLGPYMGDDYKLRFLVIWNTDVFQIGVVNGKERNGEDAIDYVTQRWREFEHLESLCPIAIFDGTRGQAHAFALKTREQFMKRRNIWGPARTLAQLEEYYNSIPDWNQPPSMPTATINDFWNILFGSKIVTPHGTRLCSYNIYVNVCEEIIEVHHGGKDKLCKFFSKLMRKAIEIGEAVIGIKQGNQKNDTVIVFPCGIEMTLAMRPPSVPSNLHRINASSGEASASGWIFGDWWDAFYREFQDSDQEGIPLSQCAFFSIVPCKHDLFSRTARIRVPPRMEEREFPILSIDKMCKLNFCLVNETHKTVSSHFGKRRETRAQVMEAFRVAFTKLHAELALIDLASVRTKVDFPEDAVLFKSLDDLIASCNTSDRNVRPRC
jgi:hypothetical protein